MLCIIKGKKNYCLCISNRLNVDTTLILTRLGSSVYHTLFDVKIALVTLFQAVSNVKICLLR